MHATAASSGIAMKAASTVIELVPGHQARLATGESRHHRVEIAWNSGALTKFRACQQTGRPVGLHDNELGSGQLWNGLKPRPHLHRDRGRNTANACLDEKTWVGPSPLHWSAASSAISR